MYCDATREQRPDRQPDRSSLVLESPAGKPDRPARDSVSIDTLMERLREADGLAFDMEGE